MVHLLWCLVNCLVQLCNVMVHLLWVQFCIVMHVRNKSNFVVLNIWETYTIATFPSSSSCLVSINGFSMWLEFIYWICNVFVFHQHILLIVCQPWLNLINNYLICVAAKQRETPRFTIEVCTYMILCVIAHYCATKVAIIIRILTIWSCICRSCLLSIVIISKDEID